MRLFLAFLLFLSTLSALACTDAKGSRNHPDIGRFKGTWILGYSYEEFDEYALPTGPIKRNEPGDFVA